MVTQPVPVARGIIYDRRGQPLGEERADVRAPGAALGGARCRTRSAVADRLARLLDVPAYTIIERLDAHTGSQFDLVRIGDVKTETARVISEDPSQFPGVHVGPRGAPRIPPGQADVARPRLDRAHLGPRVRGPARRRLLAGGPHRQGRPGGDLRERAARRVRHPGGRGRRRRQRASARRESWRSRSRGARSS